MPQNGPLAFRRVENRQTTPKKFTDRQEELFQAKSEVNDICTNLLDLIIVKNDRRQPVSNYAVPVEGSNELISAWAHISNMIPNWFPRTMYNNKGYPMKRGGNTLNVDRGTFKRGFPIREDCRQHIFNVLADLEVDDINRQPFKVMKYPIENGDLMQDFIRERKRWYQDQANFGLGDYEAGQKVFRV